MRGRSSRCWCATLDAERAAGGAGQGAGGAVASQQERIAQLERKTKRSSRDSSQPPSHDPSGRPPGAAKDPSGRAQGAQPGMRARAVRYCRPRGRAADHGRRPRAPLRARARSGLRAPLRRTAARVAASAFGARYHAAIAVLSTRNRTSRREVVELCQLFGLRISAGTVHAILSRVADALVDPYDDLLDRVPSEHGRNRLVPQVSPARAVVTKGSRHFAPRDRHSMTAAVG